jgi:hypothetical protein
MILGKRGDSTVGIVYKQVTGHKSGFGSRPKQEVFLTQLLIQQNALVY